MKATNATLCAACLFLAAALVIVSLLCLETFRLNEELRLENEQYLMLLNETRVREIVE